MFCSDVFPNLSYIKVFDHVRACRHYSICTGKRLIYILVIFSVLFANKSNKKIVLDSMCYGHFTLFDT